MCAWRPPDPSPAPPPTKGWDLAEYTLEPEDPRDRGVAPPPTLPELWEASPAPAPVPARAAVGDRDWIASAVSGPTVPGGPRPREVEGVPWTGPDPSGPRGVLA